MSAIDPSSRSVPLSAAVAAIAALGALLVLASTAPAPGISPDSVAYLAAAKSVLEGDGFRYLTGEPYVWWPPLYPAVLAGLGALGLPLVQASRVVNAAALALLALLMAGWARRSTGSGTAAALAAVLTVASAPFNLVLVYAWSEPLFMLITLPALLFLERHYARGRTRHLAYAAVLTACAMLTRYAGLVLLITGGVLIAARKRDPLRARLGKLLGFGVVATVPLTLWVGRNVALGAAPFGPRPPTPFPFHVHLVDALQGVAMSFVPWRVAASPVGAALGLGALVVPTALLARQLPPAGATRPTDAGRTARPGAAAPLTFAWVHAVFMVGTASLAWYGLLNQRLLAPASLPLLLAIVILAWRHEPVRAALRGRKRIVVVVLALWAVFPAARLGRQLVERPLTRGLGSAAWQRSAVTRYLRAGAGGPPVWVHDPDAAFVLSGRVLPRIPDGLWPGRTGPLDPVAARLERGDTVDIVWFLRPGLPDRPWLHRLGPDLEISLLVDSDEGRVYRVAPIDP